MHGRPRTDGCDGGGDLASLELVEDGGLAGSVQPQHEDARLELLRQAIAEAQQPPHGQPHHRLERPVPGDGLMSDGWMRSEAVSALLGC